MLKIAKNQNGKDIIKISKKDWELIGIKAGWIKESQGIPMADQPYDPVQNIINDINYCLEDEKKYREYGDRDLTDYRDGEPDFDEDGRNTMERITPEEYMDSLIVPYVSIKYITGPDGNNFLVEYHGNNSISSVNAGIEMKKYLDNINREQALQLNNILNSKNIIKVSIFAAAGKALGITA